MNDEKKQKQQPRGGNYKTKIQALMVLSSGENNKRSRHNMSSIMMQIKAAEKLTKGKMQADKAAGQTKNAEHVTKLVAREAVKPVAKEVESLQQQVRAMECKLDAVLALLKRQSGDQGS
jgi:hypothetical protein